MLDDKENRLTIQNWSNWVSFKFLPKNFRSNKELENFSVTDASKNILAKFKFKIIP